MGEYSVHGVYGTVKFSVAYNSVLVLCCDSECRTIIRCTEGTYHFKRSPLLTFTIFSPKYSLVSLKMRNYFLLCCFVYLEQTAINGDGLDCSLSAVPHVSAHLLRCGELGDLGALPWSEERPQAEN